MMIPRFSQDFPPVFFIWHPKANYANVAALTADALMNTCPWDYWVPGVPDPGANGSTQLQLRPAAGKATCFSSGISKKQHETNDLLYLLKVVIFNRYVSLPEGKYGKSIYVASISPLQLVGGLEHEF